MTLQDFLELGTDRGAKNTLLAGARIESNPLYP